jgi:hypothetical protein
MGETSGSSRNRCFWWQRKTQNITNSDRHSHVTYSFSHNDRFRYQTRVHTGGISSLNAPVVCAIIPQTIHREHLGIGIAPLRNQNKRVFVKKVQTVVVQGVGIANPLHQYLSNNGVSLRLQAAEMRLRRSPMSVSLLFFADEVGKKQQRDNGLWGHSPHPPCG